MLDFLHLVLNQAVAYGIFLFEFSGLAIILYSCLKGIYSYVRRMPGTRLELGKGLELGLEFKLGSEILRTVVVREWMEIWTVGSIILLRALLTFLIRWEINAEH